MLRSREIAAIAICEFGALISNKLYGPDTFRFGGFVSREGLGGQKACYVPRNKLLGGILQENCLNIPGNSLGMSNKLGPNFMRSVLSLRKPRTHTDTLVKQQLYYKKRGKLASRPAIYRSLWALGARNRKKSLKKGLLGGFQEKSQKIPEKV